MKWFLDLTTRSKLAIGFSAMVVFTDKGRIAV